jgi:Catalytic LigB subunit of aromatic ring-opening dioxygenase
MADLLLMGMTHYPLLATTDAEMAALLRTLMKDPAIPDGLADPANWSPEMQAEWGDDEARSSAATHRAALLDGFAECRKSLEAFKPDFLLVWGDDQYENFKEDIIPPYALLAYGDVETQPWKKYPWPNVWEEPKDAVHTVKGRPDVARWLAGQLLDDGIDVSYAYKPLHMEGLAHAFMNTQLFLDYDRVGFPWPMVCMPINCYGRRVISSKGFFSPFGSENELDPPSPTPRRLMDVGASVARHLKASPWRVAIVASSSWSHAFLTDKTWRLLPDTASDRAHYDALAAGNYAYWESTTTAEIEDAGQQELLNWFALAGAARELGLGSPEQHNFIETHCFNSNKVFARWPVVHA